MKKEGELFISMNKKAQGWGLDLIAALIIFIVILVTIITYAINYTNTGSNELNYLFDEASFASDIILSDNFPGILTNEAIDPEKLNNLISLNYQELKSELGLKDEFYIKFPGLNANGNDYIGKTNTTSVKNIVKYTRITIYDNKPINLDIYIWR